MPEIAESDRQLLNLLQTEFPLDDEPFRGVAERLGTDETTVLARVAALREERIIREITAIFDTASLGYQSMLVAARIPAERLDAAAAIINEHPGVSHNYRRNHEFNLWFTIAVPPGEDIQRHVGRLHELTEAVSTRQLPTLRLFKIGVQLDMTGEGGPTTKSGPVYNEKRRHAAGRRPLSERDIAVVRELQWDLSTMARPFDAIADRIGIPVEELLAHARDLLDRGVMRRFAAILHHRRAGFKANAMGVWVVPPDRVEELGERLAQFKAVSHAYQRPTYEDWPYNVFTMVHGHRVEECEEILAAMAEATGLTEHRALYSSREFKKVRLRFFTPDYQEWATKYLVSVA